MHYHYDADEYCDTHAPAGAFADDGEQDTPAHCCVCDRQLDYRLTQAGVKYVLGYIRESLRDGRAKRDTAYSQYRGTVYEGHRHCEIVRGWATDLSDYCLTDREQRLVALYLHLSRSQ